MSLPAIAFKGSAEDQCGWNIYYLCIMDILKQLVSLILPQSILEYFEVVKIEQSETLIEISLDEL